MLMTKYVINTAVHAVSAGSALPLSTYFVSSFMHHDLPNFVWNRER
jgi:hypothetical protein